MAHPQTAEAVDAPGSDMDSAAAAIEALNLGDDNPPLADQGSNEIPSQEEEGDDADLDLGDEEEDDGGDEPQAAAIEAPASLNAEEKAAFAAASPEAQRAWAAAETRRNTQVQAATTKASEAQRIAETRAAQADAQAKAVYAQQLKAFAAHLAPQAPDPMLASQDPGAYIALKAQYDAASAEHQDFVQQVAALGQEATTQLSQAEVAERDAALMAIPEVQNADTRDNFFKRAIGTAEKLGLDMSQIGSATAKELKALRDISDWQEKAEKYDAAMARQMQRVREGKKNPTSRPNAAQPSSSEGRGFREAKQRAKASGDLKDAAAAIARLG